MAHGFKEELEQGNTSPNVKNCQDKKAKVKSVREGKGMGSRRIFSPQFKLQVLDSYRQDSDCRGNQRATARKYGIHRRQIQKWLQMESTLRCSAEGASENGEVALNLASPRQRDDSCNAGCIPATNTNTTQLNPINNNNNIQQLIIKEERHYQADKLSDSEDDEDLSSNCSLYDQDQALDFTCAALSKRRFFSPNFKLEVMNAFYNDSTCYGNQRATARKFGVHRRQVQKWLNQEGLIRGEVDNECLDLSNKRKFDFEEAPTAKRVILDLDAGEQFQQPTSVQETALCLVKQPTPISEVSSSVDLFRPYSLCCSSLPETPPTYDPWTTSSYCPYYGAIHTSCVTKWLNQDAHYYKQAVKDINLYSPMFS